MLKAIKQTIRRITDKRSSFQKAIDWIKHHRIPDSGIVVHHKTRNVSPEVTGYIIDTLYRAGKKDLALDLAKWEASIQKADGAFAAPGSNVSYTFDTAQVIRGFLSVLDDLPQLKENLVRACDFVERHVDRNGEIRTPDDSIWNLPGGRKLSAYCNLYNIAPLLEAGRRLNHPRYVDAARRALNFYKAKSDLVEFKSDLGTLSHIFGYMMEALAEMGEIDLAKKGLEQAWKLQRSDGSIPAYPGVEWVCSTGLAQLGIASWMVGNREVASKILSYLEKIQNPSGGFYGGYGKGVEYFPEKEISWANKFFIDLYLLVKPNGLTPVGRNPASPAKKAGLGAG